MTPTETAGTDGSPGWTDHTIGPTCIREAGTGRPVLFLHGLGGSRRAWGPQLRGLSDRLRCIAWDMPGYGGSRPIAADEPSGATGALTYRAIADRVVRLLDDLDLEQVDLVGLSFGGMHALHTVLAHPDRIGRMVLADTSPAFGMDGTRAEDWQAARLAPIEAGATPATIGPTVLDAIVGRPLDPAIRSELIGAFGDIPTNGFRAAVACLPTNDVRADLHRIPNPTLVVVGELDRETPPAYARVLADGLPVSTMEIMHGVGHLSPSEDPDGFNRLVRAFLDTDRTDT